MSQINLPWLDPHNENAPFPSPEQALDHPHGLVAAGGDLSPTRILRAYRLGLFPWYEQGQPILWWSPDPRGVLYPNAFIAHKSLHRTLKRRAWHITYDESFQDVMIACAQPRDYARSTWITADMIRAYYHLHQLNHAHSVEVRVQSGRLIGGIYGIGIGAIFFAESMFGNMTDASKVALLYLCAYLDRWKYALIDTQLPSSHLVSLGGIEISRQDYLSHLSKHIKTHPHNNAWEKGQSIDIHHWLHQLKSKHHQN